MNKLSVLAMSLALCFAACGGGEGGGGGNDVGGGGGGGAGGIPPKPSPTPTPTPTPTPQYEIRRDLSIRDVQTSSSRDYKGDFSTCAHIWVTTTDNKLYVAITKGSDVTQNCGKLGDLTKNLPADGALHKVLDNVKEVVTSGTRTLGSFGNTFIIKTDGTLLGMGDNSYGQLNQSSRTLLKSDNFIEITKNVTSARMFNMGAGSRVGLLVRKTDGRVYVAGKGLKLNGLDGYETTFKDIGVTNVDVLNRIYITNAGYTVSMWRNDASVWYLSYDGTQVQTAYERDVYQIDDSTSSLDGTISFTNDVVGFLDGYIDLRVYPTRKITGIIKAVDWHRGSYHCVLSRTVHGDVTMKSSTADIEGNWCFGSGEKRPINQQVVFTKASDIMYREGSMLVANDKRVLHLAGYYPLGVDEATAAKEKDTFLPGDTGLYGKPLTFKYKPVPWLVAK